jgi:hypothetical protein
VEAAVTPLKEVRDSMTTDNSETELGHAADFVDDAIDDDEISPREQLLLDRKELAERGLTLDDPDGIADEWR